MLKSKDAASRLETYMQEKKGYTFGDTLRIVARLDS